MLRQFIVGRNFNKLEAILHVDCQKANAEVVILYDRRIRRIELVPYHEVSTPELADRWFSKSASDPEQGSWLEFHAMMCARDPAWLVQTVPNVGGLVGEKTLTLDMAPPNTSHPDFYPPELGGKPENWPSMPSGLAAIEAREHIPGPRKKES